MPANFDDLEKEILLLPVKDRARLAKKILLSLDKNEEDELELERLWIEEAKSRSVDYHSGKIKSRPVKEYLKDLDPKFH